MGMVAPVYYTADMVRALPDDGNRYEVVYGELLVSPAPRLWHQEVAQRLLVALTRLSRAGTRRACSRLPGGYFLGTGRSRAAGPLRRAARSGPDARLDSGAGPPPRH